jgi:hypothetical protein
MSTRSRIGIVRDSNATKVVVESIYCHFDGYPEGVGQMLLDHWTDPERVEQLITLGDMSSLGSEIGEQHDFDTHMPNLWGMREEFEGMSPEEEAAARKRIEEESPYGKGWCLFYGRDRGETGCGSRVHDIDKWPDYGQEAEYVLDPETREWRVRRQDMNPVGWNTVTPWVGWVTIPEAIQAEQEARERYEREHATA